jgi:hypothetical protein
MSYYHNADHFWYQNYTRFIPVLYPLRNRFVSAPSVSSSERSSLPPPSHRHPTPRTVVIKHGQAAPSFSLLRKRRTALRTWTGLPTTSEDPPPIW